MATISKSVLQAAKEMLPDNFNKEDIKKTLQLIYNAGYRMGQKSQSVRFREFGRGATWVDQEAE